MTRLWTQPTASLASTLLILAAVVSTAPAQFAVGEERTDDLRHFAAPPTSTAVTPIRLDRVSAAVPWPRGLVIADGRLVALARGRHRRSGGIDPTVADRAGCLFAVDPTIVEPVVSGVPVGDAVRSNATLLVEPKASPFALYDPAGGKPLDDYRMDRPYCTLVYDAPSKNFFICGYSGVDLPGGKFRKNANDTIHRFDLRTNRWSMVEAHDANTVPIDEVGYIVPNDYYPHHDPAKNPAPHGWLNGADGAEAVGNYLYAVAKDNHTLAQYDLRTIRKDAQAGPPSSRVLMRDEVNLRCGDEVRRVKLFGHSAVVAHDGYLYLGFRTSSVVIRFTLDADGDIVDPETAELIAVFEPWSSTTRRSANLIDLAFDRKGDLFAACAEQGRVWKIGRPDPTRVFDGVDVGENPTKNQPWLDLRALTGKAKARVGNIVFDDAGRLFVCSGNYATGTRMAGVIFRATEVDTKDATPRVAVVSTTEASPDGNGY